MSKRPYGGSSPAGEKPADLIKQLKAAGIKFTEKDIVGITRTPTGQIVWLEQGNRIGGLHHIMYGKGTPGHPGHDTHFAGIGINGEEEVTKLIIDRPVSSVQAFVKGVLVQNEDGATYEDVIYDRWLKLRLPDSREWWIFDYNPISESLSINEAYEMVIKPYVVEAKLVPVLQPAPEFEAAAQPDHWQGVVVDPKWEAPKKAFRFAHEELYGYKLILVATSFGNMVLWPTAIEAELRIGTVLQWVGPRLDLLAVV